MTRRRKPVPPEAAGLPHVVTPGVRTLDALFAPRRVAVVGASERPGSVGRAVLQNLSGYPGAVFAVNPNRATVLGRRAHPDLASIGEPLDLAVIATPAATVPGVIRECGRAGVSAALVVSGGFREAGPAGAVLEAAVRDEARAFGVRVLGPSSFGVMVPALKLNASFAPTLARPGSVAFLSQSGALCAAVLDWSHREHVGFSGFVSVGSMVDVGWGDLIYHFGDDPRTRVIVMYMENLGEPRRFLSAAREVALGKPVIVLKAGRTVAAARAAASHTGALSDNDEVLDAAFRRVGVLRVGSLAELFDMAEALGKQPRPAGPRLAIVTNAGGPGALATDVVLSAGGELAVLSPDTLHALEKFLPPHWSRGNPVDVLGAASPEMFSRAVAEVAADPANDGVLAILTPQAETDARETARSLVAAVPHAGKPILASWMGGGAVEEGRRLLNEAGFATADFPDAAAGVFCHMWRHSYQLRALYETPAQLVDPGPHETGRARTRGLLQRVREADRSLMSEAESKELLGAYGIPVVPTRVALSENDAVRIANDIGFPVVVKLHSLTLTHKSEVGGVHLNLGHPLAVREAWRAIESSVVEQAHRDDFLGVTVQPMILHGGHEVILGSHTDLQFGPVLLFGSGGRMAEVLRDRALGLPPLTATLALRLMEQTRVYATLRGGRGRSAADLAALEALLVRFSYLVLEHPEIAEIDINPLIVAPGILVAADARVMLHPPDVDLATLPRPAIRPYPNQYAVRRTLKDGAEVLLRPIHPEDEPGLVEFHKTLSDRSVYNRYFAPLKLSERIAHERLVRVCFSDYDREIPIVAEHRDVPGAKPVIVGIGRLSREHQDRTGEFALVISDAWQGRGLGHRLLEFVIQVARDEGLSRLIGTILMGNREMQHVCRKLGFSLRHEPGDAECVAELPLQSLSLSA